MEASTIWYLFALPLIGGFLVYIYFWLKYSKALGPLSDNMWCAHKVLHNTAPEYISKVDLQNEIKKLELPSSPLTNTLLYGMPKKNSMFLVNAQYQSLSTNHSKLKKRLLKVNIIFFCSSAIYIGLWQLSDYLFNIF